MIKKIIMFFALTSFIYAQNLTTDQTLIQGELPNGFKYTIKKNEKPAKRASLRLLVKVGSLEEDDDQKGIAHLIEHLAFNGTKHFKKNSLVSFIESMGVDFGAHLNASTGMERTMYKLDIPLIKDNLQKSMVVFGDWAGAIDITQKELDKERGVILEEGRTRNDSSYRLYEQSAKYMYQNSKFAKRMPIGDLNIIKNISLKRVKDFYNKWYQPRFMHFIIVGDFDVKKVQSLIVKTFSDIKNTDTAKRVSRDIPLIDKTRVAFLSDKEAIKYGLWMSFIHKYKKDLTEEDYKNTFIKDMATKLFNLKAKELESTPNPDAKKVKFFSHEMGDNLEFNSFNASFKSKNALKAYKQLLELIYSADKYGFSGRDFEVVKKDIKAKNEQYIKNLKNKKSSSYANEIAYYIEAEELIVDSKYAVKLEDKLLKTVSLKEVNEAFRDMLKTDDKLIMFTVKKGNELPKKEVLELLENAKKNVKKQKQEEKLPKTLITKKLKPAKILSQIYDKKHKLYQFRLSNGVKFAYKYNDYDKDQVNLLAYSDGGYSLYDTKYLPSAKLATEMVIRSGFGKYTKAQFDKIYADKIAKVGLKISRYGESMEGSSNSKDFRYLLEKIYILTTQYKVDDNIFKNVKQMCYEDVKNEINSPEKRFWREFNDFYYKNNKRYTKMDKKDIDSISKDKVLKIYKERFSDMNNFDFVIVGDISKEEVIKYAKMYLGNLPTKKQKEKYNFRGVANLKGKHNFVRYLNNENISTIYTFYTKPMEYSLKNKIYLSALADVLETKARELIREEKSGVYGISVGTRFSKAPYQKAVINIYFTCDPQRKDELVRYLKDVINQLKTKKVDEKYVQAFIKKRLVALDDTKKTNQFKLSEIENFLKYNESLNKSSDIKKIYKSITPKIILKSAKTFFNTGNVIYTEQNPNPYKTK